MTKEFSDFILPPTRRSDVIVIVCAKEFKTLNVLLDSQDVGYKTRLIEYVSLSNNYSIDVLAMELSTVRPP